MKPFTAPPFNIAPVEEDLGGQAHRPGHGIQSQDPDPAAQIPLEPREAEREAGYVLIGGGVVGGVAAGAAIGIVAAGPVGVVIGATVGALVGAVGSAAIAATANPEGSNKNVKLSDDTLHQKNVEGRSLPVSSPGS
jgi:hypothetical protein